MPLQPTKRWKGSLTSAFLEVARDSASSMAWRIISGASSSIRPRLPVVVLDDAGHILIKTVSASQIAIGPEAGLSDDMDTVFPQPGFLLILDRCSARAATKQGIDGLVPERDQTIRKWIPLKKTPLAREYKGTVTSPFQLGMEIQVNDGNAVPEGLRIYPVGVGIHVPEILG